MNKDEVLRFFMAVFNTTQEEARQTYDLFFQSTPPRIPLNRR